MGMMIIHAFVLGYVKHLQHMKVTPDTEVDEAFDCGEVSGQEKDSPDTTK